MNLYQLTSNYMQIIELSNQLDEETFLDTLESIEEPLAMKMANYVKVIRSIEGDIEMIDKEVKRLAELKASKNNTISRLKQTLLDSVEIVGEVNPKTGGKKLVVKDDPFVKSIYTQKNPPSVQVLEEDEIPEDYKVKQPDKVDSKAILAAYKEDIEVPGVVINQGIGIRYR